MKRVLGFLAALAIAAPASAQIVVDGTIDAEYGAALAVQTVQTQFGNSTGGITGGGELDAGYAAIAGGRLYVMLTGNIENNLNKVSVFIDSKAGGENVLSNLPQYDTNNVSQNFGGLTFDAGFTADYHLFGRWDGADNVFEVDIADRAGGGSALVDVNGGVATTGAGTAVQSGVVNPGNNGLNNVGDRVLTGFLTSTLEFGFNNNNSAGVVAGTAAADQTAAAAVTTGLEFSIALADIGNPGFGDLIKIHAAYGNGDNNFHSNQVLAGLPTDMMNGVALGTGNLGGNGSAGFTGTLSGVNFSNYAGDQFFSIRVPVPEPASGVLAALAGLALAAAAWRRAAA
ncbi:MAG: hypothetical protein WD845_01000 [Pirellulales bacterium]